MLDLVVRNLIFMYLLLKGGEAMKTAHKLLTLAAAFVLLLALAPSAKAAQVTNFLVTLSDTRPTVSSNHTYAFTHTSSSTLKSITFDYCMTPSGSCTDPTNLNTLSAAEGTVDNSNKLVDSQGNVNKDAFRKLTNNTPSAPIPKK